MCRGYGDKRKDVEMILFPSLMVTDSLSPYLLFLYPHISF
jgi:hypothetical protein